MAGLQGQTLPRKRVGLFGMQLDALRLDEAVAEILGWAAEPDAPLRYVVTPNVQHALLYQRNAEFRQAYEHAALVLVDGTPLVWAANYLGSPVPERVAGSDLLPTLLETVPASRPLSLFLLGAASDVAERAARLVEQRYPAVRVAGVYSPPFGFERVERENREILSRIERVAPELLVVGLGAPKQELWIHRHRADVRARVALCAGATIDFLAGEKRRAPTWMRGTGLEWLHRLSTEPRRLGPRYAADALEFPRLVYREWRARRASRGRS